MLFFNRSKIFVFCIFSFTFVSISEASENSPNKQLLSEELLSEELLTSSSDGNISQVKTLIKQGADINAKNKKNT